MKGGTVTQYHELSIFNFAASVTSLLAYIAMPGLSFTEKCVPSFVNDLHNFGQTNWRHQTLSSYLDTPLHTQLTNNVAHKFRVSKRSSVCCCYFCHYVTGASSRVYYCFVLLLFLHGALLVKKYLLFQWCSNPSRNFRFFNTVRMFLLQI